METKKLIKIKGYAQATCFVLVIALLAILIALNLTQSGVLFYLSVADIVLIGISFLISETIKSKLK